MNQTLGAQLGGQYVTAAYLFVDREAGLMRYGAAGHPPLLRWRPTRGRPWELAENGLPLGMMDVAEYRQMEQPLRRGDRFLLYTDGLADATSSSRRLLRPRAREGRDRRHGRAVRWTGSRTPSWRGRGAGPAVSPPTT